MAPCGWTVGNCGCGVGCWDAHTPAVRARAEAAAALIMWAATGRRYGPCPVTVQPVAPPRNVPLYQTFEVGSGYGITRPVIEGGQWYNRPYTSGGDSVCCRAGHGCEVALDGPTTKAQITSVTVDGEVINPDGYVVMDGYLLVRTDGACWPACVSFRQQSPPAFTVTYTVGLPIPPGVQGAFERLACEFAKACNNEPCALPRRMTRLSRQGVEIELEEVDNGAVPGQLLTGIQEVDDVIRAVNPHRLMAAPQVLTPDLPAPRRLT